MTSEIRVNKLENRVGLGTIEYSNTGPVISGVATASNFKTGSSNLHSSGVEVAGVNTLGADTPIGLGATIYNSGDVIVGGAITATNFVGGLPIAYGANNRVITASSASAIQGEQNLTFNSSTLAVTGNITATGNFVANGNMNVGSYGVFGSLVAADPGSNYYTTTNRFGGGLSLQGSLYIDGDIIHVGDTNTKIRFPVNDNISLETAGVQRFRLNEVGISTFYNSQLHIEGAGSGNVPLTINTDVAVNNSVHPLIQAYSDNATYKTQIGLVREGSSGALGWAFLTNAVGSPIERLRISSSGKVGIDMTNPDAYDKFVVSGTGNVIAARATSGGVGIGFFENNTGRFYIKSLNGTDGLAFIDADNSSERLRIDSNGYIGIDYSTPYNGLTINKEGDYWDNNGNTYAHPEGRVLSTWGGDRNDDTDYWVGFVGKYLKPSATVNILLQPHVGNFNNQAGMYIAGEATGNFSSDFTLGAISSGNVAGRGTTASSGKRATKSELLRIKHDGRLLLGSDTNRTINSHAPKLQVTGTTYSNSTISIINNEANGNGAYIFLGKQRSGAVGGNTAVQANDIIGELRFPAGDGTDMENYAARIQVKADANASSNNTSGYIDFYTTRQNGSSEHKMRMTQNSNHSHLFSMGTSSSHLNNCSTPDRTSVKIGGLLHIEGPTGHNATPGLYYNCYSGGNDLFYRGTGAPSGGDRRPAAYGQKFGGHYFYGDTSSTAWSAQQQITTMQLNMNISSQGYVTKPQTPAFFATHTGASNSQTGYLTFNGSGSGYYNNGIMDSLWEEKFITSEQVYQIKSNSN